MGKNLRPGVRAIRIVMWVIAALILFAPSADAATYIGPVKSPTLAKEQAWASTHEPAVDEDFIYEDSAIVAWFDFSSGGFLRGVWLKDGDGVLHSKNTLGESVPANLLFGGGYQLIANLGTRPDSPYENFMIFYEHSPRPGLLGRKYVVEGDGYTDIGFIGRLRNRRIAASPGFDPNTDLITPDREIVNGYIAESWPESEEYWVHVSNDPATRAMRFEKKKGDGALRSISYRIRFRIHHDRARIDSDIDVFLRNKPPLDVLLMVMDTLHRPNPDANDYIKSLGVTGLNTAEWDVAFYDNWLGIPPWTVKHFTVPKGKTAVMRHVEKADYPGNGATSFVTFVPQFRSPWIELSNGNRDASGKVTLGLDAAIRREFRSLEWMSHVGFTDTPMFEGTKLTHWWISNEAAFFSAAPTKDLEARSFAETLTFRRGTGR